MKETHCEPLAEAAMMREEMQKVVCATRDAPRHGEK
jgi:hypothetical protein